MKLFTNNLRSIYDNSRLAKLIKRGILRIFPRPVLYILALVVACTLIGCATPAKVSQLVKDVRIDTVYLSNVQYDSIYIMKDKLTDRSKDTIYIKDVSVEYRYKLLRDTVRVILRDSIPYEVTVIETKEITRPLTWFDHLTRLCFWVLLGSLLTWIYIRAIRARSLC